MQKIRLCVFLTCFLVSLTLAVPVWLGEAVLVPTGQRCFSLVVVGSVLAVICPQGALWAPLLQGVRLTLLQSWPVGQKIIAIEICCAHTQKNGYWNSTLVSRMMHDVTFIVKKLLMTGNDFIDQWLMIKQKAHWEVVKKLKRRNSGKVDNIPVIAAIAH